MSFTGFGNAGRRWSDGQHQAIEARKNLAIQPGKRRLLPASKPSEFPFLLYPRLGLANDRPPPKTEEVGIRETYKLEVTVCTHQPQPFTPGSGGSGLYKNEAAKWARPWPPKPLVASTGPIGPALVGNHQA